MNCVTVWHLFVKLAEANDNDKNPKLVSIDLKGAINVFCSSLN